MNLALASALAPVPLVGARAATVSVGGQGDIFVNPVMQDWIQAARKSLGFNIHYEPGDTAPATNAVMDGEADFAGSDDALPPDRLKIADLAQFPLVYGAIAVAVNLPGVKANQVRLNATTLAELFTGSIKNWNDPRLAALNPDLKLPDLDVAPVAQGMPASPPPGMTSTMIRYLTEANPGRGASFEQSVKSALSSGGFRVMDSEATSFMIKNKPGRIGYVSLGSATDNELTTVMLTNKAGKSVAPTAESMAAAMAAVDWKNARDLVAKLTDLPGDGSWPIMAVTYALVPRNPPKKAKGEAVKAFFKYALTDGAAAVTDNNLIGLPPAVRDEALAMLDKTAL